MGCSGWRGGEGNKQVVIASGRDVSICLALPSATPTLLSGCTTEEKKHAKEHSTRVDIQPDLICLSHMSRSQSRNPKQKKERNRAGMPFGSVASSQVVHEPGFLFLPSASLNRLVGNLRNQSGESSSYE